MPCMPNGWTLVEQNMMLFCCAEFLCHLYHVEKFNVHPCQCVVCFCLVKFLSTLERWHNNTFHIPQRDTLGCPLGKSQLELRISTLAAGPRGSLRCVRVYSKIKCLLNFCQRSSLLKDACKIKTSCGHSLCADCVREH